MNDIVLGVDIGTTSVKAALIEEGGQPVGSFSKTYEILRRGQGIAEQDANDWVRLVEEAFGQLSTHLGDRAVKAASFCSQVNTHVFVDAAGQPLLPAIVWQDTRASAEAEELDARLTAEEKIAALGAPMPIDASHALSRMLWVSRNRPEIWEKTAHVLLPKDYVYLKLTGELVTDPLANVGLVGPNLRYAEAILDLVPGAMDKMAPIKTVSEVIGELRQPLSGVPVVNGTMDGWVGLVGGGATAEGNAVYLSGTSEILGIAAQQVNNIPGVIVFPGLDGLRLHAGPTQSGGASAAWFCDTFEVSHERMSDLVANSNRRQPSPLFLPQLAGERAPLWNPNLRGAFLGVESSTDLSDLARSVFEGVAFSARHVMDALKASSGVSVDTMLCGGGGFNSEPWSQIRTDIMGVSMKRLTFNEPGIVGAACLAASGSGGSIEDAHAQFASYASPTTPSSALARTYDELFEVYKDAIGAVENIHLRNAQL